MRLPTRKTGRKGNHLSGPALMVLRDLARRRPDDPWAVEGAKPSRPLMNIREPWRLARRILPALPHAHEGNQGLVAAVD